MEAHTDDERSSRRPQPQWTRQLPCEQHAGLQRFGTISVRLGEQLAQMNDELATPIGNDSLRRLAGIRRRVFEQPRATNTIAQVGRWREFFVAHGRGAMTIPYNRRRMASLRRLSAHFLVALGLVLSLVGAQHVGALHELAHAVDRFAADKQLPAPADCEQCVACASLSSAAGTLEATIPAVAAEPPRAASRSHLCAPTPSRLAFHSRAPPSASL